jgi:ribonucleoside-triphosphate reductase
MNEVGLNAKWLRADMTHAETQEFTKEVLNHMRDRLSDYQEEYGDLYNLEATPAESTSYRLAKHDVKRYPEIITASENDKSKTPYYTNSSHLPVGYTDDIFAALDIQDELQTLYTSGTVFHAFLGEKLPSWKSAATLIRTIAENYKLPYYTLSPTYSVCKNHGYISGEVYTCPECGEKTEVYSRITGYYRPIQNWNDGKSQEYKDRVVYTPKKFEGVTPKGTASGSNEGSCECTSTEDADKVILFSTPTCPNCKAAAMFLDKAGIVYEKLSANDNPELVSKYGITQAPTVVKVAGGSFEKIPNLSNIRAFTERAKN